MSIAALRRLNDIITSTLDVIDVRLSTSSLVFPSLDDPYDPSHPVEAILDEPEMQKATSVIAAAASQLMASVRHPAHTLIDETYAFYVAPCVRAMIEGDVVEIVRDAGSKGIHVNEICKLNGRDPSKTTRILRFLSNKHIFREVSPDVFALNRIASLADTGKSVAELRAKPENKHQGTSGIPAYLCKGADEFMHGARYIPEIYTHSKWGSSSLPTETAFNIAFNTSDKLFEWYQRPENAARYARFGMAMAGVSKLSPPDAILKGFDWASLPNGSVVVDVGGGIGACSLPIAHANLQLKFVIQDLVGVVAQAAQFWDSQFPEALRTERIQFTTQDFFEPQPPSPQANVYLLRHIIHDWPDAYAKKILKRLHESATPKTKLLVIDIVIPYTCRTHDTTLNGALEGSSSVPEPLLPSLGPASNMKYVLDVLTYAMLNAQERTAEHFMTLAAECGWKVVKVYDVPGSITSQYLAVPVPIPAVAHM